VKNERVIIVGGPRRGKSTMANQLAFGASAYPKPGPRVPIRCGDPLSKVKDPLPGVEYLPEGIPISGDDGAAQWVADNWFTLPGPWVCEGWVMARALRRWAAAHRGLYEAEVRGSQRGPIVPLQPADRIIVLDRPGFGMPSREQDAMHKAVMSVWYGRHDQNPKKQIQGIFTHFEAITEYA
jgi:hypothetical protein